MNMNNNIVLIIGGTSGIGNEMARQLLALGNVVIIAGRDHAKLLKAQEHLPSVKIAICDVSEPASIINLYRHIEKEYPALNMLINCAGLMRKINLNLELTESALRDTTREINTNLNGTIWTALQFLPLLKRQPHAVLVNVSSGLAFVPMPIAPVYSASKSAVHAFTRSLRVQLKHSTVRIVELAPPATETPLYQEDFTSDDSGGIVPMPVGVLVKHALKGIERGDTEVTPGLSRALKLGNRLAPAFMLRQMSKSVDTMLSGPD